MKKILKTLYKLGLSEKEAITYITLLGANEITATKLAERTGIARTFIYEIINKLSDRGLVSSVVTEGKKYFSSTPPEFLLEELEEKTDDLKEIMPQLKSIMGSGKRETKVDVFRGRKGINSILKMIINDGEEYFLTGGAEEGCKYFEHENKIFVKRAVEKGIVGNLLLRKGDDFFIGKLEQFRYLPPKLISLVSNIIWGDKTAIFIWSDPCYAIVVEDEQIAKSNISTFKYLWKIAEKPTKADVKKRIFD